MSDLRQLLLNTATLYRDLEDALHGTRTGDSAERTSGGSIEAPLPLSAEVADHRHLLVKGLRYWVSRTRTPGAPAHTMHRVPAMVAVLIGRLPDMDAADQAEMGGNLRDWKHGATSRMDLPALRTTVPLPPGTCPNRTDLDGETVYACGGALTVMVPADTGTASWLQCRDCRTRYGVTELPDAANVSMSQAEAAALLGVPVSTVWRRAGGRGGRVRLAEVLAQ